MLCRGKKDAVASPCRRGVEGPPSTSSISWPTLERLEYFDANKRTLRFAFYDGDLVRYRGGARRGAEQDAGMWGVVTRRTVVKTILDGVETSNVAEPGDFILRGPVGEKYVVRFERMPELYERSPDDPLIMLVRAGAPRRVAQYTGPDGSFEPSWGGRMVLKRGDFVVREARDKYYRIEKGVFNDTYERVDAPK
jgi:hypothetical protein